MLVSNPTTANRLWFEYQPTLRYYVKFLLLGQIILKDTLCRDQLLGVLDSQIAQIHWLIFLLEKCTCENMGYQTILKENKH